MVLSCIVSEIKRYIGRQLIFFIPYLHSTFPLRWPSEFYNNVSYGKLEWWWKSLRICLFVSIQYMNVRTWQTSGQIERGHTMAQAALCIALCIASRGNLTERLMSSQQQSKCRVECFGCFLNALVSASWWMAAGWVFQAHGPETLSSRTCFMLPNLLQSINRREI